MIQDQNWALDEPGGYIESRNQIQISWLGESLDTWIDPEEGQKWWTEKQAGALQEFLSLPPESKKELSDRLDEQWSAEFASGNICGTKPEQILSAMDWEASNICVPQLYESPARYILLLLQTKWPHPDSEFFHELEVLYADGKIILCQEMTGLWTRLEWFSEYLKQG